MAAKRRQPKDTIKTYRCELSGISPLMFDRFAGTDTKIAEEHNRHPERRFYAHDEADGIGKKLFIPNINILSFLAKQKGASCVNRWGPQGRMKAGARQELAENILSFVKIEPTEIPILSAGKQVVWHGWKTRDDGVKHDPESGIWVHHGAGRVQKGGSLIPVELFRPVLPLPWSIVFKVLIRLRASVITPDMMEGFFEAGAPTIGLGAFRPAFGTADLAVWELEK